MANSKAQHRGIFGVIAILAILAMIAGITQAPHIVMDGSQISRDLYSLCVLGGVGGFIALLISIAGMAGILEGQNRE